MTPHPSTEDIHLAGPGQVRHAPPLRQADREPADPNALPPLAASGRDHPTRGSRRSAGPSTCVRSTDTGPGPYGACGAGPAARPSRYGRRSALRQDAAVRPCRRPRPCHQFHERWAPPRPAARRQAHDSVQRARSSPGARPAWTGLLGLRPTAPRSTAHAGIRGGRPRGRDHRPQGHGACRLSTTVPIESARCIDSQM